MGNDKLVCDLDALTQLVPGLTEALGRSLAEAAAVELAQHHGESVTLRCDGHLTGTATFERLAVNAQMQRAYLADSTENGAVAIAIALVIGNTAFTVVERSRTGTGFDYWLAEKADSPAPDQVITPRSAKLEVSGIRNGADKVRARTRQKMKQAAASSLPGFAIVVEFSQPLAQTAALPAGAK